VGFMNLHVLHVNFPVLDKLVTVLNKDTVSI
jgi:hypothetical protein